jgi:hypothetical protein
MFQPPLKKLVEHWGGGQKKFIENSFKSKLKIIAEFGHALGIIGKPYH